MPILAGTLPHRFVLCYSFILKAMTRWPRLSQELEKPPPSRFLFCRYTYLCLCCRFCFSRLVSQTIDTKLNRLQALLLAPTRELAQQIHKVAFGCQSSLFSFLTARKRLPLLSCYYDVASISHLFSGVAFPRRLPSDHLTRLVIFFHSTIQYPNIQFYYIIFV